MRPSLRRKYSEEKIELLRWVSVGKPHAVSTLAIKNLWMAIEAYPLAERHPQCKT
jgi:hypothetical protein